MSKDALTLANQLLDWGVNHRRYLHRHPELSLNEQQTSTYCQQIFTELGYTVTPSWGYGFTADGPRSPNKPLIAIRADMDALPIHEQNQHTFISKNVGVAHMCGHDLHMTIALMTAKMLTQFKGESANVRFIFQPSEELPPGGAIGMIEQGCLQDVDAIYGLHNDPGLTSGKMRVRPGPLMAAGDIFTLDIIGRGGHGAKPQTCLDPIIVAAQLINQWQSIITRRIDPIHPAALSVTKIQAGKANNVIPEQAHIGGTFRTFYPEDRKLIHDALTSSLISFEQQGFQFNFELKQGYDAVINHVDNVNQIVRCAQQVIGIDNVDANTQPECWAEDFCYYLQHKPGAFFFLGSGKAESPTNAPLHSNQFDPDEQCLTVGAAIFTQLFLA